MVASVLDAAGETVGLYTSPHLHRFVERVAVGREAISPEDFGRLVGELHPHIEAEDAGATYGRVSTFEALTVLAFMYFRERNAATQVLEVGLGGRLDATNVFEQKDVCVITPIGLEHTAMLGNTVDQIAREKAAIISSGTTVIMAPQRDAAVDVVRTVAAERAAALVEVAKSCALSRQRGGLDGQEFALRTPRETYGLRLPLPGRHQLDNAATAVLACEALAAAGLTVDAGAVREGLASVRWPCRVEVLKRAPLIIADGAHDRDSMQRLATTLYDDAGVRDAAFIFGCARDKDVGALADELVSMASSVVATRSRNPRAKEPDEIASAFAGRDIPVAVEASVGAAMDAAITHGDASAFVACGSLFVAAEAREHVLGIAYDPPLAVGAPI
jgi:dihydrofolate synthase/folylpolyglutamate synthase